MDQFKTKVKRNLGLIFLLFLLFDLKSQAIRKTIANYSSELSAKEIKGKSSLTKIIFNTTSGLLTIEDNLAAILYNDINTDTIKALKDKVYPFKFQTNVSGNLGQIFKDNKYANLIRIEGTLTLNGITKECIAYYAPILLNNNSNDIVMDFDLKFNLSDFNFTNSGLLFTDLIELEIEDGFVSKVE